MTREESIVWLESLKTVIGQHQYQGLWHYEQALAETIELLKSDRIVELPCKVGDKIYKIIESDIFGSHIQDMTIEKFALIAHTDFEIINQWNSIYFDKVEAEKRLNELKKEKSLF